MNYSHAPWIVWTAFGLIGVWLLLVAYFHHYLRSYQPAQFEALGRPSFQRGSFRFFVYLFQRGHRALKDQKFSLLCDVMLVWFTATTIFLAYAMFYAERLPRPN